MHLYYIKERIDSVKNKKDKNNIYLEIWKECEPQIRKLCSIRLADFPDEEDNIVSDVYSDFISAWSEGRLIAENCKSWLYSTANNKISEKRGLHCEKNNKEFDNECAVSTDYSLMYEYNYVDDIINDENIENIKNEIENELSESDLLIIKLRYEDSLQFSEIAKQLNSTEFEVKQHMYRLFNKIKRSAQEKIDKLL